jgi:hypothetical protein
MSDHSLVPTSPSEPDHTSAAPPLFDSRRQAAFCEALSHHGNVRLACRAAGISPQTAYRARRASADLAACWDAALVLARAHVEEVLADRALNGLEEAVYYRGEEVARRIRYDNRLLLAHLARLDKLAEQMEARRPAPFDAALDALTQGRPVERKGRAPAPSSKESEGEDTIPPLERRLRAMEDARPDDAPPLHTLGDAGEVEALQLAAFEAGEPEWWQASPGQRTSGAPDAKEGTARRARLRTSVSGLCSTCSSTASLAVLSPPRPDIATPLRRPSQPQVRECL